ncbi:hypothetical protein PLESTF_001469000 [Pleodorina starrii]|nr:hypothetical protein PLESTF_001469000 [Pleodorina starrii]
MSGPTEYHVRMGNKQELTHAQQQYENVLFAAPPVFAHPGNPTGASSGPHRAPTKRPLPIFVKPSRSSRLGAAAAAAAAACGDVDDDTSHPELDDCMLSPGAGARATADANRLLVSLLGAMPGLPGSPTTDGHDTSAPLQLVSRSSGVTSLCGRSAVGPAGSTFSGCAGAPLEVDQPRLSKSQSERLGGGGGGGGIAMVAHGGAAPGGGGDGGAQPTLTRRSVDAAAGAEMLRTRLASQLSFVAPSEDSVGVGTSSMRAAIDAAAAAAAAARNHPTAEVARGGEAAATATSTVGPATATATSSQASPISPFSAFQSGRVLQYGSNSPPLRAQSCSGAAAAGEAAGASGARGGREAGGGAFGREDGQRRRGAEVRQLPRWLSRILRALHVETGPGITRVSAIGGDGSSSSSGGGGGGGSSTGGGGVSGSGGEGKASAGGGSNNGGGGSSGGDRDATGGGDDGESKEGRGGGVGGGGGGDGGAITAAVTATATPAAATVAAASNPRDSIAAATRLLSTRLSLRSRSSEEPPTSLMASRDSTTVHRARLAQHAKAPAAAAPAAVTPAALQAPQQAATTPHDPHGSGANGVIDAVATISTRMLVSVSTPAAPATGVSVTAYVQASTAAAAATSATPAATAAAAAAAVSYDRAEPVQLRQMRFRVTDASASTRPAVPGGPGSGARRRQFSEPGGAELRFTSLSRMLSRSIDGAATGDTDAAADGDDRGRRAGFQTVASARGFVSPRS